MGNAEKIRKTCEAEGLTDLVAGPMNLREVVREISQLPSYLSHRNPKTIVTVMELIKPAIGTKPAVYQMALYVPKDSLSKLVDQSG